MSKKTKLKKGFNEVSNDKYHGDREYISSSGLKLILKNPQQFYKQYVLGEASGISGPALDFGSYLHAHVLEPHTLESDFAIWTGSQRRGKAYEEWVKNQAEKIIITQSQEDVAQKMLAEYNKTTVNIGQDDNPIMKPLSNFIQDGKAEESLCVTLDGVKVKVRFDYRVEDEKPAIYDVKTSGDYVGTLGNVRSICQRFDYDLSAALYVDAIFKQTGKMHDFYFLFMSKKDFVSKLYKASDNFIRSGREKYKRAIKRLKAARKTGIYYNSGIEEIDL